jgi:Fe-S-cluster containining protein
MQCRSGCGACCIAPSINKAFYGMPQGKAAGVRCVHLQDDARCALFGLPERPEVCSAFTAETAFCGTSREQALQILDALEISSNPDG